MSRELNLPEIEKKQRADRIAEDLATKNGWEAAFTLITFQMDFIAEMRQRKFDHHQVAGNVWEFLVDLGHALDRNQPDDQVDLTGVDMDEAWRQIQEELGNG